MASRKRLPYPRSSSCSSCSASAWRGSISPSRPRRPRRRRRTSRPGPAASTSTATARSRPRSRGCGARRPASRSCATSSTARPTTARPASVATSTGCAGTTATTCPLSAGVDPAGWTAGLRHFVDDRYRLVSSRTFDSALRSAVKRLRLTNLPVALTVSHGNHGWILTGFRATADPAATASFRVTSVRVTGPLYGLQSKNGYDMPPNTKLTTAQLKRFFTPWKYAPKAMIWDGRYVSIQPVPKSASRRAAAAVPAPSAVPRRRRRRPSRPRARPRLVERPRVRPCRERERGRQPRSAAAVAGSAPGAGAGAVTGSVGLDGRGHSSRSGSCVRRRPGDLVVALSSQRARRRAT